MSDRLFAVFGDGNITGSSFTNVGNRTFNYNTVINPPERQIFTLESRVSFDALLNSEARYPAPKCHYATRKVAQKVVKNWLCRKGEGSEKGIMWMSGAPGVGKSAIAQTVCEELCGDDGSMSWLSRIVYRDRYIDGCFFFGRGFENREKASFFPATIAFQLRRSRASCRTAIDKVIEKRPEILTEDFRSHFRHLLMRAAQTTGFLQGPITVVIDGLDECNSVPDQVALLELILGAVKTGNMRFFIASRPEQHIHTFFHRPDISQYLCHVRLDEETFNTSQDIKIFLREEFARIRRERPEACPHKLSNGEEWPGERVLDYLTVESDSQFMFPTLAIGFIDTPLFPPDKQLQILLAAPPSRAFSALDTLYHKILSRQPPPEQLRLHGEDDLREYQDVLMGILRVILAWSGEPLSAAQIATFLDKPVEVVQMIVRGSMRTLFKFHTPDHDSPITLCHKSLRDFLLDQKRSEEFFIPSAEEDDLFVALLTRPASFFPLHPSSAEILRDVLATILWIYRKWSVPQFATFLGVDPTIVERLVISGPTSVLFDAGGDGIRVSTLSFDTFLRGPDRSGALFIPERRMDTLFLRFLSRLTHPTPPRPYSQSLLIDVLAVAIDSDTLTLAAIATFPEIDASVVEHVVRFAGSEILFDITSAGTLSSMYIRSLLEDPRRSGEFFVSESRLDPVFSRMLSRQPLSYPSPSSYHDMLMGIMTVIVAFEGSLGVEGIASVLDLHDTLVKGVVEFGPAKPLFCVTQDGVKFSIASFSEGYLGQPARSGVFFISDAKIDALLIRFLSRHPAFPPSNSCSRSVLVDVLAAVLWMKGSPTVAQIAALLKVDRSLVEHVVKIGAVEWLFKVGEDGRVEVVSRRIEHFLRNVDRSRGFFVSETRLDRILIQTLAHQAPSYPSPSYYHDIVMGTLAVVVAFEGSLTIERIASVLEVDDTLVEGVVMSEPTKVLFRMWHSLESEGPEVCFSTPLIEPFLRDAARSGAFFISQSNVDAVFIRILSCVPVPGAAHSHSRDLLMDVLTAVICCRPFRPPISQISSLLGCLDSSPVEGIVLGPTKELFYGDPNGIQLSIPSLESFLKDASRSGEFCITEKRTDALFTQALSRQPPSDPSLSYSRNLLMDVLTVVASLPYRLTILRIASALEVNPQDIKRIFYGPLRPLLEGGLDMPQFDWPLINFLTDAERSGEFFVSPERIEAFFTRILSRKPSSHPSYPYTWDVLMGVLAVIMDCTDGEENSWNANQLATFLDVNPTLVEGVLYVGPSRLLFCNELAGISLSSQLLESFLKDSSRSGEFFISGRRLDPHFSRILSSLLPLSGRPPYSRDTLKDILAITLVLPGGVDMLTNAAALGLDPSRVESVVQLGLSKSLFRYRKWPQVFYSFSTASIVPFLRDAERSGDFYISDATIDTLFIRLLSLSPPLHLSDPPSKDILRGVMAVILTSREPLKVPKIATLLHVDRKLVEGVVNIIPANVLFHVERGTLKVTVSSPLLVPFLQDAHRSGEFFIPPTMTLDDIPKPWLQHPSHSSELSGNESGDRKEDDEMKGIEGRDAMRQGIADLDTLSQGSSTRTQPAFALSKRKFSRLTSSRQGSRDSANEVAASPSARTKRPKTGGSLVLDSDEPQDLYELDSDAEEAMVTETMLMDDEETWGSETVGEYGALTEEGGSSMDVDRNSD